MKEMYCGQLGIDEAVGAWKKDDFLPVYRNK